ncbi:divalent metal cation transporter [uncultured bacterium]|uniref:Divalent metal cation transporter n=2 Tax=Acetilactobacillus jinshanensis TaxID=1720083 RepID=A0A4P6ZMZ4_9LACO|nr:divalent metal cation transporter [Acetilactobacillus jinshanensis]QBP19003.1 divalent metal cation transporter [Acetilactobacillus jinshanensis]URL61901.1 divalent metal cation transporter [uncultured bacterium]
MLADTDAGCLLTAAQSGAEWGYKMVLPQIILIPVLFMVQEMTVRLGIVTRQGHGELIRKYFGTGWAMLAAFTLMASVIGALLTEFIGVAGVSDLFGISRWISIPLVALLLISIAFVGKYRRIEKIGLIFGFAELAFVVALIFVHPQMHDLVHGMITVPWHNSSYLYLVAANLGAVIMPWMIFYQQGAVIDKHLSVKCIKKEQTDTAIGTVITQAIMIGFIILFAAATAHSRATSLSTVGDLVTVLQPYMGYQLARILMGASIFGGSLVAALVVALAGTWGMTEVLNWPHSLNEKLSKKTVGFYGMYALTFVVSATISLIHFNLVKVTIAIEVMNALLLPIVLGFLLLLESRALPSHYQMHGVYKWTVIISCLLVMVFGVYMIGPTTGIW